MSGPVLSPDAIAALVDAAREGRLPEEKPAPQRRRRMRAVDFTRPTKFTAEQERRLHRTLDAFCRTASTRLSAELRVPLEMEVLTSHAADVGQRARRGPANSTAAIFNVEPIGTRMLLSTESTLLLGAIELLLGGSIDGGVKERRMTDIDQALGRHFFERLLAQLTLIWTDVAGLDLVAGDGRPAHGDRADGLGVRADAVLHARGAPERHLGHAGAADPVVGDRAGRGPVRGPRRRALRRALDEDETSVAARGRRRRDERARRGRRDLDADRGRARAQGGRPAAPQRARHRRHHALRRQGPRAHRAGPAGPAAAAPCRSPATWVVRHERLPRP